MLNHQVPSGIAMIQGCILQIRRLATQVEPFCICNWTHAMHLGCSGGHTCGSGSPEMEYGVVEVHREQFPQPTPYRNGIALEELGDVGEIRDALRRYWMWIRLHH